MYTHVHHEISPRYGYFVSALRNGADDASRVEKIYALHDPRTDAVRYVGYTADTLSGRLQRHLREARDRTRNFHRVLWIRSLVAAGVEPTIALLEEVCSGADWREREMYWYKEMLRRGCDLTNTALPGNGGAIFLSPEARALWIRRQSEAKRGRPLSPEHAEKIRAAHRARAAAGIKPPPATDEARAKMSESARRRWAEGRGLTREAQLRGRAVLQSRQLEICDACGAKFLKLATHLQVSRVCPSSAAYDPGFRGVRSDRVGAEFADLPTCEHCGRRFERLTQHLARSRECPGSPLYRRRGADGMMNS